MIAPVWQAGQNERTLFLPKGAEWVHVWSGATHDGGQEVTVAALSANRPYFSARMLKMPGFFAGIRTI